MPCCTGEVRSRKHIFTGASSRSFLCATSTKSVRRVSRMRFAAGLVCTSPKEDGGLVSTCGVFAGSRKGRGNSTSVWGVWGAGARARAVAGLMALVTASAVAADNSCEAVIEADERACDMGDAARACDGSTEAERQLTRKNLVKIFPVFFTSRNSPQVFHACQHGWQG